MIYRHQFLTIGGLVGGTRACALKLCSRFRAIAVPDSYLETTTDIANRLTLLLEQLQNQAEQVFQDASMARESGLQGFEKWQRYHQELLTQAMIIIDAFTLAEDADILAIVNVLKDVSEKAIGGLEWRDNNFYERSRIDR